MKVGKAIYNILSQSTDVQSNFPFNTTDYSPSGTELVTNGDFTETGTELVINGDFLSASSWNVNSNWNINTALGVAEADGTSNADINQGVWLPVIGKSYKVTYEVVTLTQGEVFFKLGGVTGQAHNTLGIKTQYIVAISADRLKIDSLNSFIGSVKNVSIKELGEDWTLAAGWNIGDERAIFTDTSDAAIYQADVTTVNKYYKISIEVLANEGTAANTILLGTNEINATHLNVGVHTLYGEALGNTILYIFGRANEEFSITNISVEEMVLNKIFPELAPPDIDAPYVVYSVVSNSPSDTKNANGDIDTASIEVYGFQDTYNKAVDLGVSVRAALDRKTGTYNTIEIQSTNYVNEQMDVNEARKLWAAIQDYSIRIKNI